MGFSYFSVQNIKQDNIVHTMETNLEELGFEKYGNNYCLEDTNFKYYILLFSIIFTKEKAHKCLFS